MIYGANYQTWRKESETCGGCGKEAAELVVLGNGWDFKACPACVAECAAVEARERAEHGCTVAEVGAGEFTELRCPKCESQDVEVYETGESAFCHGCGFRTADIEGDLVVRIAIREPMQGSLIPEAAAPMQRVRVSRIKEVA